MSNMTNMYNLSTVFLTGLSMRIVTQLLKQAGGYVASPRLDDGDFAAKKSFVV